MTTVPLSWLNRNAIKLFIERGSMDKFEKDLHEAGEKQLLNVIKKILESRKPGQLVPATLAASLSGSTPTSRVESSRSSSSISTTRTTSSLNTTTTHDEDRNSFIVDLDKRMIKDSTLNITEPQTDRKIFEFCMLDNDETERTYVGKQFTLVRGRQGEKVEERKRNINDGYNRVSRELHVWNKLRNLDNFVQLLHISLDDGKSITAVSESFRRDVRQSFSTPGIDFTTIIEGIAKGLDFLHKFSDDMPISGSASEPIKKIAHSDVKCANVFLREGSSTPYLADFGVSHQVIEGAFTKMIITSAAYAIGTAPWMPPELLILPDNVTKVTYTTESDVWSFGMTIYEIVSRNDPWHHITEACARREDIPGKIKEVMKSPRLPNWPPLIPDGLQKYSNELEKLYKRCCKYNHKDRPQMEDVVKELDKIFGQ